MTISPDRSKASASKPISSLRMPICLLALCLLSAWLPGQAPDGKSKEEPVAGPKSLLAVKLAERRVPSTSKEAQELQARIEQGIVEAEAMPEGAPKKALLGVLEEQRTAASSLRGNLEQSQSKQQNIQVQKLKDQLASVVKEAAQRGKDLADAKAEEDEGPFSQGRTFDQEDLQALQKSTESDAATILAKLGMVKTRVKRGEERIKTLMGRNEALPDSLANRRTTVASLQNELTAERTQVIALEALADEPANLRPLREATFAKMLRLSNLETGVIVDEWKKKATWPLEVEIAEEELKGEQAASELAALQNKRVTELNQRIRRRLQKSTGDETKTLDDKLNDAAPWQRPLILVWKDTNAIKSSKEATKATAISWSARIETGNLHAEIKGGMDVIELTANDEDDEIDSGFESTDELRGLRNEQRQRLDKIKQALDDLTEAKKEARRALQREVRLKIAGADQRRASDFETAWSAWEAGPGKAAKVLRDETPEDANLRANSWEKAFADYKSELKEWKVEIEKFRTEATKNRISLQSSAAAIEKSVDNLTAQLLWAREESNISTDSIGAAFSDAPSLPTVLWSRVTRTVEEWKGALFSESNRTLVFATIAFAVFMLFLLIYVHNRLPATISWMESREGDGAGVLKVIAAGVRRCEVVFGIAIGYAGLCAIWGIAPWDNGMIAVVFLAPFAYRFLRVVLDVLLHPSDVVNRVIDVDNELAFELHRAGRWIINATVIFLPAGILMDTAGYSESNRGFVDLWWFLYALSFAVILLTVARPSLLKRFVSGQGQFATSVRTFAFIAYPLIVGALLFLLVLHSLRYAEATKFFRQRFGITLLLVLAAFLVYRGLLRRFLPDRDFRRTVKRDDYDQAEEFHAAGRKLFFDLILRTGIRLLVMVPLVIFLSGTWRDMDWSFMSASLIGDSGHLTVSSLVWGVGTMWVFVAVLAHYRRAMQFVILPGTRLDHGLQYAVLTLSSYAIFALGVVISLNILRVQGDQIAFVLSALMVGIGFGLKDIVTNFISGIMLLVERPLKVGDQVLIGSDLGTVEKINLRSTTIMTFDNVGIVVPNGDLITGKLVNRSTGTPLLRTTVDFGVDYDADVRQVLKIADEVLSNHGQILQKPGPVVYFVGLGDSSLDFSIRFWASMSDNRMRIAGDVRAALVSRFRKQGIEIPFPQRDLHLRSVDEKVLEGMAPGYGSRPDRSLIASDKPDSADDEIPSGASPGAPESAAAAQREAAGKPELVEGDEPAASTDAQSIDSKKSDTQPKAT